MNTALIFKIIGIGLVISIAHQILTKTGRDETAMLVTVSGVIIIMLMIVQEIHDLFDTVIRLFGI